MLAGTVYRLWHRGKGCDFDGAHGEEAPWGVGPGCLRARGPGRLLVLVWFFHEVGIKSQGRLGVPLHCFLSAVQ